MSSPQAARSCNLAQRPESAIVISQPPIGTGQGVYLAAQAEPVTV